MDAGIYAKQLMSNCYDYFDNKAAVSPVEALTYAHSKTKTLGSSTACIAVLHGGSDNEEGQGVRLTTCNLGDSGFLLMRGGEIVFESKPQTHGFNFPLQLQYQGTDR